MKQDSRDKEKAKANKKKEREEEERMERNEGLKNISQISSQDKGKSVLLYVPTDPVFQTRLKKDLTMNSEYDQTRASSSSSSNQLQSSQHSPIRPLSSSLSTQKFDIFEDDIYLTPISIASTSKISCLECRTSKIKCSGGDVCERCKKLGKECVYKEHRRGRFSDSKRVQHLEGLVQTLLKHIRQSKSSSGEESRGSDVSQSQIPGLHDLDDDVKVNRSLSPFLRHSSAVPLDYTLPPNGETGLIETYQHDRILSQPSQLFSFVRQKVGINHIQDNLETPDPTRFDPIQLGILTIEKARHLTKTYKETLEEKMMILDEKIHTFDYIRTSSSFLLTSICFITSIFDPKEVEISNHLDYHLTNTLIPAITSQSNRSVEIVQAFILLAYYYPKDNFITHERAWIFIGLASRIGFELGLHRPSIVNSSDTIVKLRSIRNRERTWFNVWICEWGLCELKGISHSIPFDPFILSPSAWLSNSLATSNDRMIVCQLQFHLILAKEAKSFEHSTFFESRTTMNSTIQSIYSSSIQQLDNWKSVWSQYESISPFIKFYWFGRGLSACRLLECSTLTQNFTISRSQLYKDAMIAFKSFIKETLDSESGRMILYDTNFSHTIITYCSTICLHLIEVIEAEETNSEALEVKSILEMTTEIYQILFSASQVSSHRRGVVAQCAPYLLTVYNRVGQRYGCIVKGMPMEQQRQSGNNGQETIETEYGRLSSKRIKKEKISPILTSPPVQNLSEEMKMKANPMDDVHTVSIPNPTTASPSFHFHQLPPNSTFQTVSTSYLPTSTGHYPGNDIQGNPVNVLFPTPDPTSYYWQNTFPPIQQNAGNVITERYYPIRNPQQQVPIGGREKVDENNTVGNTGILMPEEPMIFYPNGLETPNLYNSYLGPISNQQHEHQQQQLQNHHNQQHPNPNGPNHYTSQQQN